MTHFKVVYTPTTHRYVLQQREGIDWYDDEAFSDLLDAKRAADHAANLFPQNHYRVIDTHSDV